MYLINDRKDTLAKKSDLKRKYFGPKFSVRLNTRSFSGRKYFFRGTTPTKNNDSCEQKVY